MKLFYAARSPFARKPRIVLPQVGLAHGIDLVVDPWKDETLRQNNPLCKVPTLVLNDRSALYKFLRHLRVPRRARRRDDISQDKRRAGGTL